MSKILLDAQRNIVIAGRSGALLVGIRIAWRQHASRLEKRIDRPVILDGRENSRRVLGGRTPDADTRIIENRASSADSGLAVTEYIVGETEARSPVCGLLIDKAPRIAGIARQYPAITRVPGPRHKGSDIGLGQQRARVRILRHSYAVRQHRHIESRRIRGIVARQ